MLNTFNKTKEKIESGLCRAEEKDKVNNKTKENYTKHIYSIIIIIIIYRE